MLCHSMMLVHRPVVDLVSVTHLLLSVDVHSLADVSLETDLLLMDAVPPVAALPWVALLLSAADFRFASPLLLLLMSSILQGAVG